MSETNEPCCYGKIMTDNQHDADCKSAPVIPCPRCGSVGPEPCGHAAVVASMGDADGRQLLARLREVLATRPSLEWYVSEDGDMQSLVDGKRIEVGADDYSIEDEELTMLAVNAASRFLRFDTTDPPCAGCMRLAEQIYDYDAMKAALTELREYFGPTCMEECESRNGGECDCIPGVVNRGLGRILDRGE